MEDGPYNQGRAYARRAEDLASEGRLEEAIELHIKAAEEFLKATQVTTSPDTIKLLRLHHLNHTRRAADLKLRLRQLVQIQQQQRELVQRDSPRPTPSSQGANAQRDASSQPAANALPRQPSSHAVGDGAGRPANPDARQTAGRAHAATPVRPQVPQPQAHPIAFPPVDDDDDLFQGFWDAIDRLIKKIPNPFASSAPARRHPQAHHQPQGHQQMHGPPPVGNGTVDGSFYIVPSAQDARKNGAGGTPRTSGGGEARDPAIAAGDVEAMRAEIAALREQVRRLTEENERLRAVEQESDSLRHSVAQFKRDVHQQAVKYRQEREMRQSMQLSRSAMLSSALNHNMNSGIIGRSSNGVLGSGSIAMAPPASPAAPSTQPQQGSAPAQASQQSSAAVPEAQWRRVLAENEKLRAELEKHRVRWESLKASAKKKKDHAPNASHAEPLDSMASDVYGKKDGHLSKAAAASPAGHAAVVNGAGGPHAQYLSHVPVSSSRAHTVAPYARGGTHAVEAEVPLGQSTASDMFMSAFTDISGAHSVHRAPADMLELMARSRESLQANAS